LIISKLNVFKHSNYIKLLEYLVSRKKVQFSGFTYARLANEIGVHKTYLSQCLKGRAHLNSDQAFALCEFFGLNDEQSDYFQLLLEYARSGNHTRKKALKNKIESIRAEKLKTENQIDFKNVNREKSLEEYYLNPLYQLIHISFSIKKFKTKPELLKDYFRLDNEEFDKILSYLENNNLISINNSQIEKENVDQHLSKNSPLYESWKDKLRLQSLSSPYLKKDKSNYQYSAIISADDEGLENIKLLFQEFLSKAKDQVKNSTPTTVCQLNFDLIKWLE
jgi:uncharacterized protein (TIGR02147 family)